MADRRQISAGYSGWETSDSLDVRGTSPRGLPNYNVNLAEKISVDEDIDFIVTQGDIEAALAELNLEEELTDMLRARFSAGHGESDPRDAQRSRDLASPTHERRKRPFLRKGLLERRNKVNSKSSRAKRKYLDDQVAFKNEKHIVYSRQTLADMKKRTPFHADCAHGHGSNSALPLGFSDRALIEALKRLAEEGDVRAQERLRRILGRLNRGEAYEEDEFEVIEVALPSPKASPKSPRSPQKLVATLPRADAQTYRDENDKKAMAVTCTPRSAYESSRSSGSDDSFGLRNRRRRKKKKNDESQDDEEEDDVSRVPSAPKLESERITLLKVLSWFDDYDLHADDRFMAASERAGFRAFQQAEERKEHMAWLALPEAIPFDDNTSPTILRLELRLASSHRACWMDSTGDLEKLPFEAPLPNVGPINWVPGLQRWWLAEANEQRRRVFLDAEILYACQLEDVLLQAEKFQVHQISPEDSVSEVRERRQRWRDFRAWYFGPDGAMARQSILTKEVGRLSRAWDTEWAKWVRFAHTRGLLSQATQDLLGNYPLRWTIVQAFIPDLLPITEELTFRKTWGENLEWGKMSHEERLMEANAALCDQVICSIAEAEGIKRVRPGSRPSVHLHSEHESGEHNDDLLHTDSSGSSSSDEDNDEESLGEEEEEDFLSEEEMEIFLMWFAGNTSVRETFLQREIQCAAGDFIMDRPLFVRALTTQALNEPEAENGLLKRRLTMSAITVTDKRMGRFRDSILSEASMNQDVENSSFKSIISDIGDIDLPILNEVEGWENESEVDASEDDYDSKQRRKSAIALNKRKREVELARADLENARKLFAELLNKCDESESDRMTRVSQDYDRAYNSLRRRSVRHSFKAISLNGLEERLTMLSLSDQNFREAVDALKLRRRASEVAEHASIESIRDMGRAQIEALEIAFQIAQQKMLEALRFVHNGAEESFEEQGDLDDSRSGAGRLRRRSSFINEHGKTIEYDASSAWDEKGCFVARSSARHQGINQLQALLQNLAESHEHERQRPSTTGSFAIRLHRASVQARRSTSLRFISGGIHFEPLERQTSTLKDDLARELSSAENSSAVFEQGDPSKDPTMNNFKTWYARNKQVRMTYLRNRVDKLANYRAAMRERGQASRVLGRGVFTPEEDLEVPPVDEAVLRRIRRKKVFAYFDLDELEEDDELMRQAEARGQAELEAELQRLRDAELRALRKKLMREIAKEVLLIDQKEYLDDDAVDVGVLGEIRFAGELRQQAVDAILHSRYQNGSGLENGDEEYEKDLERFEAERVFREAEEKRRKEELLQMRAEDEALRKYYVRERRALLMAAAERELNEQAMLERDEYRQRQEHPSGLCWRELQELDRKQMEEEDFDSRLRWEQIEAAEAAEALQIQEEAQRELALQLAEEEALWAELEERRRVAQQDAIVCIRELNEMAEEDLRSYQMNKVWEEERHRLQRLRWMERIAFARFDPFFKAPRIPPFIVEEDPGAASVDVDDSRCEGLEKEIDPIDCTKKGHPHHDRHDVFHIANRIQFLAPLSNRYQQMIGIPADCRTSDTYTRKFRSLRKLRKHETDETELARRKAAKRAARAAQKRQRQQSLEASARPVRVPIGVLGQRAGMP